MNDKMQILSAAAKKQGLSLKGAPAYGWHQKSIGSKAESDSGNLYWVKLISAPIEEALGREWEGEVNAGSILLSNKPKLVDFYDQVIDGAVYRVLISELAKSPVSGPNAWTISRPDEISEEYLFHIFSSLRQLRQTQTNRVNTRYDLVRRRVFERWGTEVDERHCEWETVHGDLHWSNLTSPDLSILDWEGWGRGLRGQDVAFLLAFSGLYPDVCDRIRKVFASYLAHPKTMLALMFATSELLRMAERYGDHPELVPSLEMLGEEACRAWQYSF